MCRLFGFVADRPVDIRYWMQDAEHPFVGMSSEHAHGWGIGWYDKGEAKLVKEPVSAVTSAKFGETVQDARSSLFVSHIRKATCGEHSMCNSHPFQSEKWFFAHNGTVDGAFLKECLESSWRTRLGGDTDSEIYFLWLLQNLQAKGPSGLKDGIRKAREREYSALNFVMSDGETLYAYWEQSSTANPPNPNYYRLYFTSRKYEAADPARYGANPAGDRPGPRIAMLVCSEKLDSGAWESLPERSLLTVSNGTGKRLTEFR
jgi:predicted glutamine amidotransferase